MHNNDPPAKKRFDDLLDMGNVTLVHTRFALQQRVLCTELGTVGVVLIVYIGDQGLQYNVRYFHNGDAKTVYFFEQELEEVK